MGWVTAQDAILEVRSAIERYLAGDRPQLASGVA